MSEEALWNAVIVQAIEDLFRGNDKERIPLDFRE